MNDTQDIQDLEQSSPLKDRNGRSRSSSPRVKHQQDSHTSRHGNRHVQSESKSKPMKCPNRKIMITTVNAVHVILNLICQLMIGAVNMIVLKYYLKTKDLHALLCCQAWHLFSVEAILTMIMVNSWGAVSHKVQRRARFVHIMFQIISMALLLTGQVKIMLLKNKEDYAAHGVIGVITSLLMLLTVVAGPTSLLSGYNQNFKFCHMSLGLPTFIFSSVILILGILKKKFMNLNESAIIYLAAFLIAFYTLYITISVIINGISIIRAHKDVPLDE